MEKVTKAAHRKVK